MSEWGYEFTRRAERSFRRLQPADQKRVLDALDRLIEEPLSGDVRKLRGKADQWRLRVGELRVLFVPLWQRQSVLVRDVGQRSNIYGD